MPPGTVCIGSYAGVRFPARPMRRSRTVVVRLRTASGGPGRRHAGRCDTPDTHKSPGCFCSRPAAAGTVTGRDIFGASRHARWCSCDQ
ncbi:protein of unknown function [Blastococcus saxobsidens DD2]|uniref:Uncharacterized protein n=1 Tax=Blastococcus saxobsidens (strain DD2) TaxID=1146883 RepID=H6RTR9_BLASD|nr:protein of unknown function [Blastococcus saxobsidens DD2]